MTHPLIINDDLGTWRMKDNATRARLVPCGYCGAQVRYLAVPIRLTLPDGIDPIATIAARADFRTSGRMMSQKTIYTPLGINCGCYAKFHRQVAHIRDTKMARRASRTSPRILLPYFGGESMS